MYHYVLGDGSRIDVTGSDSHSGPGVKYGQRCGSANWYRVNDGEWVRSNHRTMHRMIEWIELSQNMADFMEGENDPRNS